MLKEMVIIAVFLFALFGIVGSLVFVQKTSARQNFIIIQIMKSANEIN